VYLSLAQKLPLVEFLRKIKKNLFWNLFCAKTRDEKTVGVSEFSIKK